VHILICSSTDVGRSDACHSFQLMLGLIFWPEPQASVASYLGKFIDLVEKYNATSDGYLNLNRDAYDAQFAVATNQSTASWATDAYAFCDYQCAIIQILVSDTYSLSINNYFYQLENGSCSNPLPVENW
jgi:GR25 family glycosyltransferase involved in LPS biosynthesis